MATKRTTGVVSAEVMRLAGGAGEASLTTAYGACKSLCPGLSIGQFHDVLRMLVDAGSIRLTPWTRAYAEIAKRREAMYFDGEVMYWVYRPTTQGE